MSTGQEASHKLKPAVLNMLLCHSSDRAATVKVLTENSLRALSYPQGCRDFILYFFASILTLSIIQGQRFQTMSTSSAELVCFCFLNVMGGGR